MKWESKFVIVAQVGKRYGIPKSLQGKLWVKICEWGLVEFHPKDEEIARIREDIFWEKIHVELGVADAIERLGG